MVYLICRGVTGGLLKMKTHSRFSSCLLMLFVSFLGCAIIFWGSHDKVSLYQTTVTAHPVAKAKLLSGRELASDSANVSIAHPPAEPGLLTAIYFAVAIALLCALELDEASHDATLPIRYAPAAFTHALRRRPPPPHTGFLQA